MIKMLSDNGFSDAIVNGYWTKDQFPVKKSLSEDEESERPVREMEQLARERQSLPNLHC